MNNLTTAKKMSRNMKHQFKEIPLEDLESEAYVYLMESQENNPAAQYVDSNWKLYHYATAYVVGMRECRGDAIEWLNNFESLEAQSEVYRTVLENELNVMHLDAKKGLSDDGNFVLDNVLSGELLNPRDGSKYKILSMELVKDNLVSFGWTMYRAKQVVSELKFWWREYGTA